MVVLYEISKTFDQIQGRQKNYFTIKNISLNKTSSVACCENVGKAKALRGE